MNLFIKKTIAFIFIPFFIVLFMLVLFDNYLNQSALFKNYSFDSSTESKIFKLPVNNSHNIIIAGDSRAERQLIPQIVKSITGINSLNIAVSAGDLALTVPALTAYSDSSIFIISASSWQVNDGAIDPGYLSIKCFQQMTLPEKIQIYKYEPNELVMMYIKLLKSTLNKFRDSQDKYFYKENIIQELGFLAIEDTLSTNRADISNFINSHSWYKNLNSHAIRYQIFVENLDRLAARNSLIIIYQPPISPIWKEKTKNTSIDFFEKEYSKILTALCSKYDNVVFYDFYAQDIYQLNNSMYYDYQHLNRNGAEIFSKLFSEKINAEIKAYKQQN